MNCILIQDAFSDYLNGDKKAIKRIEKDLSNQLKKDISITIIPKKNRKELFAMAVTPEASVIEKIATSIASSESKLSTVTDLWRKCQKWTLEIDAKLFDFLNAGDMWYRQMRYQEESVTSYSMHWQLENSLRD